VQGPFDEDNLKSSRVTLLALILTLAALTSGATFLNALIVGHMVQKEQLTHTEYEANRAYAVKLAASIDEYLLSIQRQLQVSAKLAPALLHSPAALENEVKRLVSQSDGITAALIVDADNGLMAFASAAPELTDRLDTLNRLDATSTRQSGNVLAYRLANGQLVVAFSEPIAQADGKFAGLVGAVILLQRKSAFDRLLSDHFHSDGSSIYVVDDTGLVLAHQDTSRIGTRNLAGEAVQALARGETGAMDITNYRGERFFAGYAPMTVGKWGVVVQTPVEVLEAPQRLLLKRTLLYSIPTALLGLALVVASAMWISRPLAQLAARMRGNTTDPGDLDRIDCRYAEAQLLKEAVKIAQAQHEQKIEALSTETMTDAMTQLMNRRGLAQELQRLPKTRQPFSVLALDLDHFKRVNDKFGHATGDKVLIALASIIRQSIRGGDLPFRAGGEEFLVLMPGADRAIAAVVAERIRATVESTEMPDGVGHITLSIGVAFWPEDAAEVDTVLDCADQALYAAKRNGRNRIEVYAAAARQ